MFDEKYKDGLKKSPGWPPEESFKKGPVAVIECIEEIPCNPCETVCPNNCISVGKPITNLPVFSGTCSGCGKCAVICPGLAIFIIDTTYSETEASIAIPYELLPLPEVGDTGTAMDRNGSDVCEARVIKVAANKKNNKTSLVTIAVEKKYFDEVRFFRAKEKEPESG